MPLKYAGEWNGILWAVWKIEETEPELWQKTQLNETEVMRVEGIRHPRRRLESLAARAALQSLSPPYAFTSLSHSFPWAAAATAPFSIGIDIENWRTFPAHVWDYFTHPSERQLLSHQNLTEWHFWCAKEVSYKLLCKKYDEISFRRELIFTGDMVQFQRGQEVQKVRVHFIKEAEWLLGLGYLLENA